MARHSPVAAPPGCDGSCGTVFKVTPSGDETVLYRFTGGADGGNPLCVLARDKAGNLYGTTPIAGASQGTVFEITAAGKQKSLRLQRGKRRRQSDWWRDP